MGNPVHALCVVDEGSEDVSVPFGGGGSTAIGDTFGDDFGEYVGVNDGGSGVWWDGKGFVLRWW